jgi:hypothetical protein
MTRQVGGRTFEGQYFIVNVPEDWNEMTPLPPPGPDDMWFDNETDFKAALNGPWIRKFVRRERWKLDQAG